MLNYQIKIYDNKYSSIIDIYNPLYLNLERLHSKNIYGTLSNILDKHWCISLIKIESVSETQAKPRLVSLSRLLYIYLY